MLIYGYRGKKCPVSTDINNHTNLWALYHYFGGNYTGYPTSMVARHIYCSYSTLCKFNNSLVNTYEVNDDYIMSIEFVKNYLEQNKDIENSFDDLQLSMLKPTSSASVATSAVDEAIDTLVAMGLTRYDATQIVKKVATIDDKTEDIIKKSLKNLSK